MNKLALIFCLTVIFGAMANPIIRESRHAVPVGITMDGMIVMEDDGQVHLPDMIGNRNEGMDTRAASMTTGKIGPIAIDQQGEEQRFPFPYGGYGGGWSGPAVPFRPWSPYNRPWGLYTPYRPWY